MTRFSGCTLTCIAAVVLAVVPSLAQNQEPMYSGEDLVAWSQMQTPHPVPQTSPRPEPVPDPSPETPAPQPSASPQSPAAQPQAEPAAQTFSGTIIRDGGRYVLKVAGTTSYQLDDQEKAKSYAGQKVRVIGSLDTDGSLIHVTKIEPVS